MKNLNENLTQTAAVEKMNTVCLEMGEDLVELDTVTTTLTLAKKIFDKKVNALDKQDKDGIEDVGAMLNVVLDSLCGLYDRFSEERRIFAETAAGLRGEG